MRRVVCTFCLPSSFFFLILIERIRDVTKPQGARPGARPLIPPPDYICGLCRRNGHYLEDCPSQGKDEAELKKEGGSAAIVNEVIGVPRSQLQIDKEGVISIASYERGFDDVIKGKKGRSIYMGYPDELQCTLCKGLLHEAQRSTCCGKVACASCWKEKREKRSHKDKDQLERFPSCLKRGFQPATMLAPDVEVREKEAAFRKERQMIQVPPIVTCAFCRNIVSQPVLTNCCQLLCCDSCATVPERLIQSGKCQLCTRVNDSILASMPDPMVEAAATEFCATIVKEKKNGPPSRELPRALRECNRLHPRHLAFLAGDPHWREDRPPAEQSQMSRDRDRDRDRGRDRDRDRERRSDGRESHWNERNRGDYDYHRRERGPDPRHHDRRDDRHHDRHHDRRDERRSYDSRDQDWPRRSDWKPYERDGRQDRREPEAYRQRERVEYDRRRDYDRNRNGDRNGGGYHRRSGQSSNDNNSARDRIPRENKKDRGSEQDMHKEKEKEIEKEKEQRELLAKSRGIQPIPGFGKK